MTAEPETNLSLRCRSVSAELHSAQCQAEADAAHVKRAMAPAKSPDHGNKELLPDPAAVHRAVALRVRPRSLQARLPASLAAAVRSGRLPRRVAGNALRCSSCLFASSAGACPSFVGVRGMVRGFQVWFRIMPSALQATP